MKHLIFILGAIALTACNIATDNNNEATPFGRNWHFLLCDTATQYDSLQLISGQFPAEAQSVDIPHTPRIEPIIVDNQWQGICWYAKTFTPQGGERRIVTFEAAMNIADVWVDGKYIMQHKGGYLPFCVDVTDVTRPGYTSTIVVRLNNYDNAETGPKPLNILDFCTYGGIYRNVSYQEKSNVYITNAIADGREAGINITTNIADNNNATVNACIDIKNASKQPQQIKLELSVSNANGQIVAKTNIEQGIDAGSHANFASAIDIVNAALWSPDEPNLYTLHAVVNVNGTQTDMADVRFGIRQIDIKPEGLWINGKKTFLRGVNRHQEFPYVGYAAGDAAQWRDAYRIKKGGFDYVRASHYPPSPAFLDACDELGIMVLDAILGWQYFGDSAFQAHALVSSEQLIRRDRNHPCILAWELSINETQMPDDFMTKANNIAHVEQHGSYSAGWVRNQYDIYIEARQHRHQIDKSQPLLVSEYADWEYYAQNAGFNQDGWGELLESERSSRQPRNAGERRLLQQATNVQEAHNDNLYTHAFADGYWVMFDYNRGYINDIEYSGLMDIMRLPKPAYYFFSSQRSIDSNNPFAEPMVHIASTWTPNISKSVRVFSNCNEVELYIDGKLFARQKPDQNDISNNLPHPPFTFNVDCINPGVIEAKAFYNGNLAASHCVRTAGKPSAINLAIDQSGLKPQSGTGDIVFVYASIVDNAATVVSQATDTVTFSVSGNAQLVGPAKVAAEAGIAGALIRIGNSNNAVKVEASCNNMHDQATIEF